LYLQDIIVNLGDLLQRWTNDYLTATVHRVVNYEGRERYSVPFFFEPNFETVVECLPQFVTADNPARYPCTTSGQHLMDKIEQTTPK
jgi:isopenicillin N synthase-like dioxygenase